MHGNVSEWCLDGYADNISTLNGAVNTNDPWNRRLVRGGCWWESYSSMRSARREGADPTGRNNGYGFRVVCMAGLQ
jgi:formylglycine-generating enzyme required for sulfatase activity